MFERIDQILSDIESAQEELKISLGMAKLDLVSYVMIKRCSMDMPEGLEMWQLQEIDEQVAALKSAIDQLSKIRREVLSW